MLNGGGDWANSGDTAGRCFEGTFCPPGQDSVPTMLSNACPVGQYCPMATPAPANCPAGTYRSLTGAASLADCANAPAGRYTEEKSSSITGDCAPGYYCPERSTSPKQVPCPARFYRANPGARSADDCSLCTAGSYCEAGTVSPKECTRGYYCITGVSSPEPCRIGTFGNSTGLKRIEDCSPCSPGYFCDGMGLPAPRGPCDPGYYCLAGSYTSAPHAPGSPTVAEPSSIGGLCPAGGYCPTGSSFPASCDPGTYNNFTGAIASADCQKCDPGMYCAGSNNPHPTGLCTAGYYCTGSASAPTQHLTPEGFYTEAGSALPTPCPPGTFNSQSGQVECSPCIPGYYCLNHSTIVLKVCPVGHYCETGTSTPVKCPKGTFSNKQQNKNVTECSPCTPGQYCYSNGMTAPTGPCSESYYCPGGQYLPSNADFECPAGHYCPEASAFPTPCPSGRYSPSKGNKNETQCLACSSGSACNSTGLVAPSSPSSPGHFCSKGCVSPSPIGTHGVDTNGLCPAGHFCPEGTVVPQVCPEKTFVDYIGASSCTICPAGYFCDGISTSEKFPCPLGSYCPSGTGLVKPRCPRGTYGRTTGLPSKSNCTLCEAGKYCSQDGLVASEGECRAGYVCKIGSENEFGKIGAVPTNPCPAGEYCPTGSYQGIKVSRYESCRRRRRQFSFGRQSTATCMSAGVASLYFIPTAWRIAHLSDAAPTPSLVIAVILSTVLFATFLLSLNKSLH